MGSMSRGSNLNKLRRESFCPHCQHCRPDTGPDMSPLTEELKALIAEMEDRIREGRPSDKETGEPNE